MRFQVVFEMMIGMLLSMLIVSMVMYLLAGSRSISAAILENITIGAESRKVIELEKLCGCYSSG